MGMTLSLRPEQPTQPDTIVTNVDEEGGSSHVGGVDGIQLVRTDVSDGAISRDQEKGVGNTVLPGYEGNVGSEVSGLLRSPDHVDVPAVDSESICRTCEDPIRSTMTNEEQVPSRSLLSSLLLARSRLSSFWFGHP